MSNEVQDRVPREMRTPITEAFHALGTSFHFWNDLIAKAKANNLGHDCDDDSFIKNFFGEAWDDPETNGDKLVEELKSSNEEFKSSNDLNPYALLQAMQIVVAYSVQAMKAKKNDSECEAWTYAVDASYWAGILDAAWAEKQHWVNPATVMARLRHAENYAMSDDAIKYWRENIDPNLSASKAANVLISVVPMSHKKLAEVIAAEKKKRP